MGRTRTLPAGRVAVAAAVATGIALGLWIALMLVLAFVVVPALFGMFAPMPEATPIP